MHLWCLHALDQDCRAVSFSELQGNQIWPLFSFQKHPSLKRRLLCFASYFNFSFLCFGDMDTVAFACLRMSVWESQKQVPWAFLDWQSQNHRSRIWHLLSVWSRPPCHLLMIHFTLTSLGAKSVLCLRVSRWTTSASFLPVYSSMFSLFDWFDGSICKRKSNGLCFCMRNSFSVLVPLCLRLGLSLSETQLPGTKVMRRSALWNKESLAASRHDALQVGDWPDQCCEERPCEAWPARHGACCVCACLVCCCLLFFYVIQSSTLLGKSLCFFNFACQARLSSFLSCASPCAIPSDSPTWLSSQLSWLCKTAGPQQDRCMQASGDSIALKNLCSASENWGCC